MNEKELARAIAEGFDYGGDAGVFEQLFEDLDDGKAGPPFQATTFENAGLLTTDSGVVLRFRDGTEYQITVKRTK